MGIRIEHGDLKEIYRIEDSIENKSVSNEELMSAYDKIISITDNYDYTLSPDKEDSDLMKDIHRIASHRASALEKKMDACTKEANKMLNDGKERQAKDLFEKCKILHNQWIAASKKAAEPVKFR